MTIRRVDHGGAAIEHMVAREQQAIFLKDQTQVVGGMAWGVQHPQSVGDIAICPRALQSQFLAMG